LNFLKKNLNEINSKIEISVSNREENEKILLTSFQEVNNKVKSQIADEKLKREKFEENIFALLEETTKQINLIN
jgi:hypothetical protein